MKLQNEEIMLKTFKTLKMINKTDQCIRNFNNRKKTCLCYSIQTMTKLKYSGLTR